METIKGALGSLRSAMPPPPRTCHNFLEETETFELFVSSIVEENVPNIFYELTIVTIFYILY